MTNHWGDDDTHAKPALLPQEAAHVFQRGLAAAPMEMDQIDQWSNQYSQKPSWMKINQKNTWFKEKARASQEGSVDRRFPKLPAKGVDPKIDKLSMQRHKLIITEYQKTIVNQVLADRVTILCGETGCGKSTQVVQYLVAAGLANADLGRIAITEPRRVAAMTLSRRVAEETNTKLGEEVGYKIRFDNCTSDTTLVQYMTDGVLLRECVSDPLLSKYSVVIVDEAHERSINIDVLLGLLRGIVNVRGNFKIVIMSATIDMEKFSSFFYKAPIIRIPGKSYNVEILHSENDDNFTSYHKPAQNNLINSINAVVEMIIDEAEPNEAGDILIFLYGQDIIEDVCEELGNNFSNLLILPLYRALPVEMQNKIFEPSPRGKRKVIVATNIAESSLTIDGVKYVIDSGFMRVMKYSSINEVENLDICTISHEHATQRSGRAGRTQPGVCYRLYTEEYYNEKMPKHQVPELLRSNMVGTLLQIKAIGVSDLLTFDFLDPPKRSDMVQAHLELLKLKAIKADGALTLLGEKMALFPIDAYLSKMLLVAHMRWGCSDEVAKIAAMLSCLPVLLRPNRREEYKEAAAGDAAAEQEVGEEELPEEVNDDEDAEARYGLSTDAMVKTVVGELLDKVVFEEEQQALLSQVELPAISVSTGATRKFYRPEGDLIAMLDAWDGFCKNKCSMAWCKVNDVHYRSMCSAKEIYEQLCRIMKKAEMPVISCDGDYEKVQRTVADVMFYNLSVKSVDGDKKLAYHPLSKRHVYPIGRNSVLREQDPDYIIYNKLNRRGTTFMGEITVVKPEWFAFKLPPPFSLQVDKDFKDQVSTNRYEEEQLIDRILQTYSPNRYGTCPLDAHRDLQKKLDDQRKASA